MSAITWPAIGSVWVDDIGRTLHVREIQPGSKLGRHVVGTINARDYACDLPTWEAVWRDRCVSALGDAPDSRPRQQYAQGLPVRRQAKAGGK